MQQPPCFVHPSRPSHICRLYKAIYGARQAPRALFRRLSIFLVQSRFIPSVPDKSVFVLKNTMGTSSLFLDDIILTTR